MGNTLSRTPGTVRVLVSPGRVRSDSPDELMVEMIVLEAMGVLKSDVVEGGVAVPDVVIVKGVLADTVVVDVLVADRVESVGVLADTDFEFVVLSPCLND